MVFIADCNAPLYRALLFGAIEGSFEMRLCGAIVYAAVMGCGILACLRAASAFSFAVSGTRERPAGLMGRFGSARCTMRSRACAERRMMGRIQATAGIIN